MPLLRQWCALEDRQCWLVLKPDPSIILCRMLDGMASSTAILI